MADIRIPEEYERGFIEMRQLTERQAQELASALESEPPTLDRASLRSGVASKMSDLARADVDRIVDTLFSLYALQSSLNLEASDLADVICDALDESGVAELAFEEDEDRDFFKALLIRLLAVDSLVIATKANDLLYEDKHAVRGSTRIITDIRPVFRADPEDDPAAALIVHTLKISYHDGGRIEDFLVTLDAEQVDELIGALVRASSKAESLKRMLAGTTVPFIDAH